MDRHQRHVSPLLARKILRSLTEKPDSLVDIGVGPGFLLEAFAELLPNTTRTGVDINPAMLRLAQQRLQRRPSQLLQNDVHNMRDLASESHGLALSYSCFHHFADLDLAFRECHRILRPGGHLALCDVNPLSDEGLGYLRAHLPETEHYEILAKAARESVPLERMKASAQKAGFKILVAETLSFHPEDIADFVDEIAASGWSTPPQEIVNSTFFILAMKQG